MIQNIIISYLSLSASCWNRSPWLTFLLRWNLSSGRTEMICLSRPLVSKEWIWSFTLFLAAMRDANSSCNSNHGLKEWNYLFQENKINHKSWLLNHEQFNIFTFRLSSSVIVVPSFSSTTGFGLGELVAVTLKQKNIYMKFS